MRAPCSAGFWSCPSTLCLRRGETLVSVMPAQKPFKTNEVPRCTTHELELQEQLCCRKMYVLKIIQYLCDWCIAKWYRWCPESISSPRCSPSCWLGVSGNQAALAAERLSSSSSHSSGKQEVWVSGLSVFSQGGQQPAFGLSEYFRMSGVYVLLP